MSTSEGCIGNIGPHIFNALLDGTQLVRHQFSSFHHFPCRRVNTHTHSHTYHFVYRLIYVRATALEAHRTHTHTYRELKRLTLCVYYYIFRLRSVFRQKRKRILEGKIQSISFHRRRTTGNNNIPFGLSDRAHLTRQNCNTTISVSMECARELTELSCQNGYILPCNDKREQKKKKQKTKTNERVACSRRGGGAHTMGDEEAIERERERNLVRLLWHK